MKFKLDKKKVSIIVVIILLIAFGGWAFYSNISNNQPPVIEQTPQVSESNEKLYKTLDLYYVNDEYVKTGNEGLDKVIPIKVKVFYDTETKIEEAIVKELYNIPTVEGQEDAITTSLKSLKLLGVENKEGVVYVDFSSDNLSGSSLQETLLVEQIVNSLLGLENVDGVKFLVDGEKTETLMGHMGTEYFKFQEITKKQIEFSQFKLGMSIDDLIEKIGIPKERRYEQGEEEVEYLKYDGVSFMTRYGNIYQIVVTSNKYSTISNIKVGDSVDKVIKVYGEPIGGNRIGVLKYKVGDVEALYITINDKDKVEQIKIIEP